MSKKAIVIFYYFLFGTGLYAQKPGNIFQIDSVLNSENFFKPLDEYKGLIYFKDENIKLNTSNLESKYQVYSFTQKDTVGIRNLLRNNNDSFFLLVEVKVKKTAANLGLLNYTIYETSNNLFNYKPIWGKGKNLIKGITVGNGQLRLKYSKVKRQWLPVYQYR